MTDDCFACRKLRGELPPPGSLLYDDDLVDSSHIFDVQVRGDPIYLGQLYPGTPRELRWYEVDEWEGARHGGTDEIAATVERIRAQLPY